jgi:polygalacturonase
LTDTTCLPPQPVIPTGCAKVAAPRTVAPALDDTSAASKNTAVPESASETLDNGIITPAFAGHPCVELTTGSGGANAFLIGQLKLTAGQSLVVDEGVTVYASRNPRSYGTNCVVIDPTGAVSDTSVASDAQYTCGGVIMATGDGVSVLGRGTIDGQGGEPLIGVSPPTKDIDTVANPTFPSGSFSWWNVSDFQRHDSRATGSGPGSAPNPALIRVDSGSNFVLYGLNLYNSPFFHVQLNSDKFVVWGINLLTPTNATSSAGQALSNYVARNTDGIDPGAATGITQDGYIVGNKISTGDDMVAIKGDALGGANDIVVAHNHFGTGHGMSLGSDTILGITNVHVYDLTIDGDVPVDANTGSSDLNGLRIKSYTGNGGFVKNVLFEDVCTRDEAYPIYVTASYDANPLVNPVGVPPNFQNITVNNFHQLDHGGPQHPFEVTVYVEGDSTHQATIAFNNVYVEKSTGKKAGPILTVKSTATLTGTMNVGDPSSNDPCTGKTWWPAAPTIP